MANWRESRKHWDYCPITIPKRCWGWVMPANGHMYLDSLDGEAALAGWLFEGIEIGKKYTKKQLGGMLAKCQVSGLRLIQLVGGFPRADQYVAREYF